MFWLWVLTIIMFCLCSTDDNVKATTKSGFRIGLVTYTPKGFVYTPGTDSVVLAMQDVKSIIENSKERGDKLDMLVLPESFTSWSYYYDKYEDVLAYSSPLPEPGSHEAKYGDKNNEQLYVYSRLAREHHMYIVAEVLEEVRVEESKSLVQSRVIVINRDGEMVAAEVADTEMHIVERTGRRGHPLVVKIGELPKPIVFVSGLNWIDLNRESLDGVGLVVFMSQIGITPFLPTYDIYRTYEDKYNLPVVSSSVMVRGGSKTTWDVAEGGMETDFKFFNDVVEVNADAEGCLEVKLVVSREMKDLSEKQYSLITIQGERGYGHLGYNKLVSVMSVDWYTRNSMGLNMIELARMKDNLDCSKLVNGKCRSFVLNKSAKVNSKNGSVDILNTLNKRIKVLVYGIRVSNFTFEAIVAIGDVSGVELKIEAQEDDVVLVIPNRNLGGGLQEIGHETKVLCESNNDICGVLIPRVYSEV